MQRQARLAKARVLYRPAHFTIPQSEQARGQASGRYEAAILLHGTTLLTGNNSGRRAVRQLDGNFDFDSGGFFFCFFFAIQELFPSLLLFFFTGPVTSKGF